MGLDCRETASGAKLPCAGLRLNASKSESGLKATHAPDARLPTLSRTFGSQRHVSLAKSVRRKHRSDRLEL
ncbi:unnamed protein product [Brassica napus]|uniref:(rape) hypothetical protein n=1 Tax=Brassica napus TaxID=3708 RepID=A0A816SZ08_BRANA|nr:unnamed protein product [Brassica napus]